jgi:hypothetical protein
LKRVIWTKPRTKEATKRDAAEVEEKKGESIKDAIGISGEILRGIITL